MKSHNPTFILLLVGIGILAGFSYQQGAAKNATPIRKDTAAPVSALYPTIVLAGSHSK